MAKKLFQYLRVKGRGGDIIYKIPMTKDLLLSTSFQGALVILVGALLQLFKVQIANDQLTAIISSACVLIGTIMAAVGRIKANQPIGSIFGVKLN